MNKNIRKLPRSIFTSLRGILACASLTCFLVLSPTMAFCENVTLAWDANIESDLKGYIVYYGTASGNYTKNVNVGKNTQYTTPDLQDGVTYYFAVTAYNEADLESDYSKELPFTVGSPNSISTYSITATAGANGSISPAGIATVDHNSDITYTITAHQNYRVSTVWVDGNSQGAVTTYTFENVTQNHTISASFVASNQKPIANAGSDQTVNEGATVTLNGGNSTDPGGSIVSYSWEQTDGLTVQIINSGSEKASFVAPSVGIAGDTLTFRITVIDDGSLTGVDTCIVKITKDVVVDSDGDGVSDEQDDFPYDADEYLDTDGDGEGNKADTDDDNDGMPDEWELSYGLNPLKHDAGSDPDGDGISNINEFNLGTAPNHYEGNFKPDTPTLMMPENGARVSLTPQFETEDFNDPNINDVHGKTQWVIVRAFDDVPVFDATSNASLTSLTLPKQILEEDTEYIWKARFIDNHDTPSEWSEEREFISGFADHDSDKNGVPDVQEVADTQDLDEDGTADINQSDIKCANVLNGADEVQVCISIKDAENADSIISLEVEDPADPELNSATEGKPDYFEFGLLDFKLLVANPGDETTVTIFLSEPAFDEGNCFKYDPVDGIWLDYSEYTDFSPNRKQVYLTLKDGGFGDADGIENGIIVDPLAFGSDSDPNGGSDDSPFEDILNGLSCFISTAAAHSQDRQTRGLWQEIRGRELSIIFIVILVGFLAKVVFAGVRRNGNVL